MQNQHSLLTVANAQETVGTAPPKPAERASRFERIFEAMRNWVEQPDSRLQHYKQDFYKHDRAYLQRTYVTGTYGWIVRESGTHLVQLERHPRMNEELDAALHLGPKCDCYLIDAHSFHVRPISVQELREHMSRYVYVSRPNSVAKNGCTIALMEVSMASSSHGKPPQGVVQFRSVGALLSHADLVALAQIGACEVIQISHSLFTGTQSIQLDGSNLFDLIEQRAE
jgi:hypothetical protein